MRVLNVHSGETNQISFSIKENLTASISFFLFIEDKSFSGEIRNGKLKVPSNINGTILNNKVTITIPNLEWYANGIVLIRDVQ